MVSRDRIAAQAYGALWSALGMELAATWRLWDGADGDWRIGGRGIPIAWSAALIQQSAGCGCGRLEYAS